MKKQPNGIDLAAKLEEIRILSAARPLIFRRNQGVWLTEHAWEKLELDCQRIHELANELVGVISK